MDDELDDIVKRGKGFMSNWKIDKAHSTIGFEVRHMMISKVRGEFNSFEAKIEAEDLSNLENAEISFTICTDSITTHHLDRDNHLKSSDFFDVHRHPTITFSSTHIKKLTDNDRYQVQGDLTIKGITETVVFDVLFSGRAINPWGDEVYGFEAEAHLNREDFSLLWNAALETGGVLVGKEVTIVVQLEIIKENVSDVTNTDDSKQFYQPYEFELSNEEMYQLIAENFTDVVIVLDENGSVKYVNPAVYKVLGYEVYTFKQHNFFEKIHPEDQKIITEQVVSYAERTIKNNYQSEFRLQHEEGHYINVESDIISTDAYNVVILVIKDISEQKEAENAILQLAFRDTLTNLPNRRSFINELRNEMLYRKNSASRLSVVLIDLDGFKQIDDQLGHGERDAAIKETADRIKSVICSSDSVARFGGGVFAVLLKNENNDEDTSHLAEQIFNQFSEPVCDRYSLTPSIGVANFPEHGNTPEELINHADIALQYAKVRGKNDYIVFNEIIEHQSLEKSILENALRQGLNEQQFYLVYQPKVKITTNEVVGMEALVRWNHPELGVIPPNKFIPLAEETGLIIPLGEWILKESCRQAVEWEELGYSLLNLSVNISVRQLEDVQFVNKLKAILKETGMDPMRLELEITESILVNAKSAINLLKEIRELGVKISVDDFGTGYSSLSYLKELPIDTIKIDQSFIKDIHVNNDSKEIARALINLANSIGLNAIAEGIEQKEHVEQLKEDGYQLGQGYFYSKPLKPDAFEAYLKEEHEVS